MCSSLFHAFLALEGTFEVGQHLSLSLLNTSQASQTVFLSNESSHCFVGRNEVLSGIISCLLHLSVIHSLIEKKWEAEKDTRFFFGR